MKQENALKFAGLEHPREEETAPTRSFFPAAFCFNLCRQPFLWSTKDRNLTATYCVVKIQGQRQRLVPLTQGLLDSYLLRRTSETCVPILEEGIARSDIEREE
ncbi:hypothetical protein Taro_008137 [Colocasia esculenta]|uniref:Uncharacterized protein n=1 Tax=Colocasia esculenta TaxID=4460 RepID=A0A843TT01_COLES|nr:hypothetical protein [Colocasia esculenta]